MLFLVRHGQSEANAAGVLAGRVDSALTELGCRQADALGEALTSQVQDACRILTSPLQRAVRTADAIAAALPSLSGFAAEAVAKVETDERFIELDYGELDSTAPGNLPPGLWDHWCTDSSWRPPGGETLEEVAARVRAGCEDLTEEAARGDVIIVSHVSPIKAAVAWALGSGPELAWRLSLGVASITRISTGGPRGPQLVSFNETAHLSAFR